MLNNHLTSTSAAEINNTFFVNYNIADFAFFITFY